jgi:predicted GIY-YIG superfamily endonuclease
MHFVYILKCCDGKYYVGATNDLESRVETHSSGKGPDFTASRLPVQLVYQESFATLEQAVRRERQLKGWSRAKKEALVTQNLQRLSELAACRSSSATKSGAADT